MTVKFYYLPGSAPCRSVLLTAKAVGVELDLHVTNLQAGEHMKPEYIKMNPQHTVPTIDDDGFSLWESRAICTYLINQYGKKDSLYPKDSKKRAIVDQRLYFDMGTLYARFGEIYYPMMFGGAPKDEAKVKKLDEAFGFLNTFLEGHDWAAGDEMTVADLVLVSSVSTVEAVGHDFSEHPNVVAWYARCKKGIDGYQELNQSGADQFAGMFKSMTSK